MDPVRCIRGEQAGKQVPVPIPWQRAVETTALHFGSVNLLDGTLVLGVFTVEFDRRIAGITFVGQADVFVEPATEID